MTPQIVIKFIGYKTDEQRAVFEVYVNGRRELRGDSPLIELGAGQHISIDGEELEQAIPPPR